MIAYIIITIFLLWLSRKIKNPLITLLIGIFMILLYQSSNIGEFINSFIPILNINNLLYNHRLLFLIVILFIYLHIATLNTVGLSDKVSYYVTKVGSRVNNLYALCLSPFGDYIEIEHQNAINPIYRNNSKTLSFLFIGSTSFIISYVILSTLLSVNQSFGIILATSFMVITIVLYNLVKILLNKNETKVDYVEKNITGVGFVKMRFLLSVIFFITVFITLFMFILGYYLLQGLALGLLCSLVFSVIYVDSHLFNSNQLDERNLFNNLIEQIYKWIQLFLLVFVLITFITLSIQVYTINWQVTYSDLIYYFLIVIAICIIVSCVSDNYIYVPAIAIPLIVPILNLVSSNECLIVVACLLASLQVIYYIRDIKFSKKHLSNVITPILLALISVVVIILFYLTHNLIVCYVTILVSVIILNLVNKFRKQRG